MERGRQVTVERRADARHRCILDGVSAEEHARWLLKLVVYVLYNGDDNLHIRLHFGGSTGGR